MVKYFVETLHFVSVRDKKKQSSEDILQNRRS